MARLTEELGFDAFFRSDHYMRIGEGDPGPGLDRRVGDARRARARDVAHPPRHARDSGDVPVSGRARHLGRAGRRDERGPRRARPRWRAGTTAEHAAYGIPFPPTGTASRCSRTSSRSSPACGRRRPASGSTTWAGSTRSSTPPPCRSRCSADATDHHRRVRREAHAAPRGAVRRRVQPAVPARRLLPRRVRRVRARVRSGRARSRRRCATRSRSSLCVGRDEAEFERRAAAIGRTPDDLRANAAGGLVDEVVERIHAFGEAGAETVYLQVLDLDDHDHVRLDRGRGRAPPLRRNSDGRPLRSARRTAEHEHRRAARSCGAASRSSASTGSRSGITSTRPTHRQPALPRGDHVAHRARGDDRTRARAARSSTPRATAIPRCSPTRSRRSTRSPNGRIVLGLGGGWLQKEYDVYGMPYGTRRRTAAHARRVHPVRARAAHAGAHDVRRASSSRCSDAQCEPKPVQERLPIWIGGGGEKVTLRICARARRRLERAVHPARRVGAQGQGARRALRTHRPRSRDDHEVGQRRHGVHRRGAARAVRRDGRTT